MNLRSTSFISAAAVAALALPGFAQDLPNEGPVPTTALISVQSKNEVTLNSAALKLEVNGHAAAITSVAPVRQEGAQIAILLDDGLRGNFGTDITQLQQFITSLPANAQVLVGYMQNGTVRRQSGFSSDHAAVASSIRVPLASPGMSASPYFCLSEFVKHWPGQGNGARVVLMITNGVDPYNGSVSPMNQDSPYVLAAQRDAERAGVAVYSIYYPDSRMRGGLVAFSGQSYLEQVAQATGGESFYEGTITPPSITPYLDQFRHALSESFLITFRANAGGEKRDTLIPIKVKTAQSGLKVRAPEAVHPGESEQVSLR